jgi:hypothetical protein
MRSTGELVIAEDRLYNIIILVRGDLPVSNNKQYSLPDVKYIIGIAA